MMQDVADYKILLLRLFFTLVFFFEIGHAAAETLIFEQFYPDQTEAIRACGNDIGERARRNEGYNYNAICELGIGAQGNHVIYWAAGCRHLFTPNPICAPPGAPYTGRFWFPHPACRPDQEFSGPRPGKCEDKYIVRLFSVQPPAETGRLAEAVPNGFAGLIARVYNPKNEVVSGVGLRLKVDVAPHSGGHGHHDHERPKGLLSNGVVADREITGETGPEGFGFAFSAPAPAGDHTITIGCLPPASCKQEGAKEVWVGVKGLQPIPDSPAYKKIHPNADIKHSGNHYLTEAAIKNLQHLAQLYRDSFPNDPPLHLNDASLERGGLFDNDYSYIDADGKQRNRTTDGWWKPPHATHRLGHEIDIRANPSVHPTTSIPVINFVRFERFVNESRATRCPVGAGPAYPNSSNQHYHVCLIGGTCCR